MNVSIIRYILGSVLKICALFLLLPCMVAIIYREYVGVYYLLTAAFCFGIGYVLSVKRPVTSTSFLLKEGCVATALSWIVMSLIGCLPFYISGEIPSFTDALFETISGFTTTGASILSDVEALSYTALFWRSFTHWIGGMGVLVFLLAVVPLSGGSNINLMKAESPGPSVGKLMPNIRATARILYTIYLALTVLEILFLMFGGCPVFDSVTISFSTAGTGGFAIKNDSIAGYSSYVQWVVTVFMVLFGVNFNAYFFIISRKIMKAFSMEEVRTYFAMIAAAVVIIAINTFSIAGSAVTAVKDAAFQVASIISSTGYATTDYNMWPETSKTVLILIMFIGACAGSTGGGIKVSRIIILTKSISKEIVSYIHPKSIRKIKLDNKTVPHDVVRSTNVYFITFVIIFCVSLLLITFENKDGITNFTAIAACINNTGPGLAAVGPASNFGHFGDFSKYVLMFDMLAGRLELFPMLILFQPVVIRSLLMGNRRKKKKKIIY